MIPFVGFLSLSIFLIAPIAVITICAFEIPKTTTGLSQDYFIACILLEGCFLLRTFISDKAWIMVEVGSSRAKLQELNKPEPAPQESFSASINADEGPSQSLLTEDQKNEAKSTGTVKKKSWFDIKKDLTAEEMKETEGMT